MPPVPQELAPRHRSGPLHSLEPTAVSDPRLRPLLDVLYRQRWLFASIVSGCITLAAAASFLVKPFYQADGSIIIEHPSQHLAQLTPEEYPPPVDEDREMQTALTVLASRAVAALVIDKLDLEAEDPEISRILAGVDRSLMHKGWHLSSDTRDQIAEGAFATKLKLLPDKISRTVHVEYGSGDASLAARVVNATADEFMQQILAARLQAGDSASHWLHQQLSDAEAELGHADDAVQRFQMAHAYAPLIAPGGSVSPVLDRLADANHDLGEAQAERIAAQALRQSYSGSVVAALPAELRNPAIDRQVENVGAAQASLTTLEATYRSDFPAVQEARERLANEQQKLADLRDQVSAGLEQRLISSQQRESQLTELVDSLNRQAASDSSIDARFEILKRRAEGQRTLVETLRQRAAEVELVATLPPVNVRVLDTALVPLLPAYPRWSIDLELGLGIGLLVGLGTILARERWSGTLTATEAVKQNMGSALAPLGMIPDHARMLLSAKGLSLLPAAGGPLESYAKVAANLVARCGAPPRAILVTSPNPSEGKTMTTCQIGLALSRAGWQTLIVDADPRRPSCHRFFELSNAVGLLAAQQGLKVQPQVVASRLDLLACEEGMSQPLQPRAIAPLLEQWREKYDYILLDTPPGNLTGEAVLLSTLVDGVWIVLRWGSTRLREAQQLCEELARAQAPLIGTVFNRTNPSAPAYRYYRRHQNYYPAPRGTEAVN